MEHGGDGYSGGGGYCDWEENCDYYHTNATWYGGTNGGDGKSKNEGFGGHGTGIKGQGFLTKYFLFYYILKIRSGYLGVLLEELGCDPR